MSPLHPFTVHLPIGLLLGHAILTLLYLRRGDPAHEVAAYHCLWLGWLGLLPAVLSGTIDAARQVFDTANPRSDVLPWLNAHAAVGLLLMVVYWQTWQLRRRDPAILSRRPGRNGYLVRAGIGFGLLIFDGWLGGQLVYTMRLGVAP
ncbi:MAG TPA: DUF2231 domain-containing protein [Roseiflexaceae bacterium]|nr:DUF2231 domain-containing protein [Roseiflexaceae bacterium]HMP42911.1 DUF2231 domain-containing protein [Roseiflexaceae bacterium]